MSSSTTEPRGCSSKRLLPDYGEVTAKPAEGLKPGLKRKGRRRRHLGRRDLDGDHLVRPQQNRPWVAGENLRTFGVAQIDVDDHFLVRLDGDRRNVCGVELLRTQAVQIGRASCRESVKSVVRR